MSHFDPPGSAATGASEAGSGEYERLSHAVSVRFAPHVAAAAASVRAAEQELAETQERLRAARDQAAGRSYRSDPLVFMRATVREEVAAVDRKTTEKKVRAAFRYLLDRAVELAEGEVQGFSEDQRAAQHERSAGVEACQQAERAAAELLAASLQMQDRVLEAQRQAFEGLRLMLRKLAANAEHA